MFKELGHYKEFYIDNKFIGTITTDNDGRTIGWEGRKQETSTEVVVLNNGKKIKPGQVATTIIYPLSGRIKK
jgi:hypothetical protein